MSFVRGTWLVLCLKTIKSQNTVFFKTLFLTPKEV